MENEHQDDLSVDSEDEARKHEYGLYLLKRLIQIKRAQANRQRLQVLLRAFNRWSYEFPLAQKCDEMSKQLRERNLMMDTVRSSYLRDVVSIKYHLDKIMDAEVDPENPSLVKLKQNMYDLHTLPSVDLRSLVDNARASAGKSSAQLRDSLVDAGLLDPETLRTLNPWDQSRGYRRIMRIKKGGAAKPPDLEGESIAIAAPSNKKLFVRYCKDCIGLSIFIKDWNTEVEQSLKFKADFSNIDGLIQEYRGVIDKLNGTIEGQEKEIVRLLERTSKLETANAWFEKWGVIKEAGKTGKGAPLDEYEQKVMYKHNAEMARAEMDSFAFNSAMRLEAKERSRQVVERAQRQRLHEAEASKTADSKERAKIVQEFRKCQQELQGKLNEITELNNANAVKEAEKTHLMSKLSLFEAESTKLHEFLDRKEAEYATLREESNTKIEDLKYTVKQLNNDYNKQETVIDELRDNVLNKKMEIQDRLAEIADLKQRIRELEAMIPPPRPRFTLRVVALAVRYLMRLYRMLRHKDYESMGQLGYKELMRRQDKYVKMLTNANEKYQHKIQTLENAFSFQAEELRSYRCQLWDNKTQLAVHDEVKEELRRTRSLLRHTERAKEEAIAASESSIEAQNVIINQRVHGALESQHGHHLQQAKIYAQIQRNLSHHLAQSLFRARTIISSFDIESDLAVLEKPYEAALAPAIVAMQQQQQQQQQSFSSDPSSKSPVNIQLYRGKSTKALMLALRTKSRRLISWIKKNRVKSVMMPRRVPVVLFRQPRPGEDKKSLQADKARSLQVMTHVIRHDFEHVEEVRRQVDEDMRKMQDYVFALKSKHNELLNQIQLLEEELREERMPSQSSRTNRKRIGDIKSSYSHLMGSTDSNHQNSYFSYVLNAIESVQAEHGEMYKDKLIKSGKFKLSDLAREVVRRNSGGNGKSLKLNGASFGKSVKADSPTRSAKVEQPAADGVLTRSASTVPQFPLSKLPSVAELEQEHEHGDRPPGQLMQRASSFRPSQSAKYSSSISKHVPSKVPEHLEEHGMEEEGNSARSPRPAPGAFAATPTSPPRTTNASQPSTPEGLPSALRTPVESPVASSSKSHRNESASGKSMKRLNSGVSVKHDTSIASEPSVDAVRSIAEATPRPLDESVVEDTAISARQPNNGPSSARSSSSSGSMGFEESERTARAGSERVPPVDMGVVDNTVRSRVNSVHGLSQPDSGRSYGFEAENGVHPADPPRPPVIVFTDALPTIKPAEEDTIGFESNTAEDSESEPEVDEDVLYMEDLLAAKDEMRGLLTREEVIQNRIKQAEDDKVFLEEQVQMLESRLEKKKREYIELEQKVIVTSTEHKELQAEIKELSHQNELLREIVEEDYRFHAANMEKALEQKEETVRQAVNARKVSSVHQFTQVSCAVCAIKEEGLQRFPAQQRIHNGYDDATVAMVNEQFTKALNGDVVLIAKPRRINKKSLRTNQENPDRGSPAQILKEFEEIFQQPLAASERRGSTKLSAGGALDSANIGGKRDPSPTNMGFSELLMKHLDSSQQQQAYGQPGAQTKPSSAGRNGAPTGAAEGSKFSRIKKMPPKNSSSSGDLGYAGGIAGQPQRPHSASLATLKRNYEQRTESHTAAYLQNRLMVGVGTTPQIAPVSSEYFVPLHTVDIASSRPEPTSVYLAQAVQNKQRAASASSARIEHTSSSELLGGASFDAGSGGSSHHSKPPPRAVLDLRVHMPAPRMRDTPTKDIPYIADITDDLSDAGVEFV